MRNETMSKPQISEANKDLRNEDSETNSSESQRYSSPRKHASKNETTVEGYEETRETG
jgi:hypothetical protein